jgi:hypothetical protein
MDSQQDHEATPNKKMYRGSWLGEHKAKLKWAGLAVLLLLLAGALPPLLSAYNATGQCLSRLSKLSESEMKLRVVKSSVAHYLEGAREEEKPGRRKIMFLGRSITQQELIERSQSETLLDVLKERPLLLSDEDQLNQFSSKIDAGEFTILDHFPETTYEELVVLPGKSLNRVDPTVTTEFFKRNKHLGLTGEKLNNFGNYLYEYESYQLETACCNGKSRNNKEEITDAKKRNLDGINFQKRFPEHRWSFPVSNCGSVWFPAPPRDNRINFLFD